MSEQKPVYLGKESEDHVYEIRDEASPRDYFAQIPNLVDVLDLSPHAYRLYGHLRKVAGETGKCWQSTKTLAKACDMSAGKVSESKEELERTYPPLIRIESKTFDRGAYHEIAITDIWEINHKFWKGEEILIKTAKGVGFHNMNEWRSQYELDRSQYETKKNPVKEEPKYGADAPKVSSLSIENQIYLGVEEITIPDNTQALRVDAANLIAMGFGSNSRQAYDLVMAFQNERNITFTESDIKGQRKAVRALLEKKVKPNHIQAAVKKLIAGNMTIIDLFGVIKTAVEMTLEPVFVEARAEYQPFPFTGEQ